MEEEVVVPDDASGLELDRLALERERRTAARRQKYRRLVLTRRYDRFGLSGPLVFGVLLLLGLTAGAAVVLLAPSGAQHAPAAAPLAAVPVGAAYGDLLPSVTLSTRGTSRAASQGALHDVRDFRPAVVVLLPQVCPCRSDLAQLIRSAHSHGLRVHAVLPGEPVDLAAALALTSEPETGGGVATLDVDASGVLASLYPQTAGRMTVLVVGADGVLLDVRPGWTAQAGLTSLDLAAGLR